MVTCLSPAAQPLRGMAVAPAERADRGASDEELARLHVQGDHQAFRQLVERYGRSVFNLLYQLVGNRHEAEELTQEVFLRLHQALPGSRLDLPFRPWVYRIAVNLARSWARRPRAETFSDLAPDHAQGPGPLELPDEGPLPVEQLEAEERREMVRRAVDGLPPAYRAAITLRYVEGLSYLEMSQVLDLPLNTVRTHLHRARLLLRKRLGAELEGRP